MSENQPRSSDRQLLAEIQYLGDGTSFAEQIFALVARSQFFAEFNRDDIAVLSGYMQIYRAQPGQPLIRERNVGDYMLLVIEGEVDIFKTNPAGEQQHMTLVTAGRTLGEMSMIDGEPRFATCIAAGVTVFGVLSRDNMIKIVMDKPALGAKVLIKLVTMLSQRLRQTSAQLLRYKK